VYRAKSAVPSDGCLACRGGCVGDFGGALSWVAAPAHPGHRRIPVSVELIVVGDFGGALSWVAAPAHPAPAAYIPIRGNKKTAAF